MFRLGGHCFLVYLSCIGRELRSRSIRDNRWLRRCWVCSSIQFSQVHIALHRHNSKIHGRHFSRVSLQALHTLFLPSCHTECSLKNSQSICSTQGSISFSDSLYRAIAAGHPSCFKCFSWRFGVQKFWTRAIKDLSFFAEVHHRSKYFLFKEMWIFLIFVGSFYQQLSEQCHCTWPFKSQDEYCQIRMLWKNNQYDTGEGRRVNTIALWDKAVSKGLPVKKRFLFYRLFIFWRLHRDKCEGKGS